MKQLNLCVNGGRIFTMRYDPRSDADCLYVMRQIDDICTVAYRPQNHVMIWQEDEYPFTNTRRRDE